MSTRINNKIGRALRKRYKTVSWKDYHRNGSLKRSCVFIHSNCQPGMDHITMKYPSQSVIHNVHMTGKTLAIQVTKNNATLIKAKPGIRFVTVLPSFKEMHYYIQLYSFNLATKTARRVSCNIITRGLSQLLQCSLRGLLQIPW